MNSYHDFRYSLLQQAINSKNPEMVKKILDDREDEKQYSHLINTFADAVTEEKDKKILPDEEYPVDPDKNYTGGSVCCVM